MVVFGILFLFLGAISAWILDDHILIGNQSLNMDTIGLIFLFLGALTIVLSIIWMRASTNTSHREEHDVYVDKVPDEEPVTVRRRKPRKKV